MVHTPQWGILKFPIREFHHFQWTFIQNSPNEPVAKEPVYRNDLFRQLVWKVARKSWVLDLGPNFYYVRRFIYGLVVQTPQSQSQFSNFCSREVHFWRNLSKFIQIRKLARTQFFLRKKIYGLIVQTPQSGVFKFPGHEIHHFCEIFPKLAQIWKVAGKSWIIC